MTVTDTIQIDAAPDVVWAVTVDVERWPEWTPTVTAVRLIGARELGPGRIARIRQPMQPASEWVVRVFDPGRRFVWETRRMGLRMTAIHALEPSRGGTRNVLTVEATGPLARVLAPVLRRAMARALAEENRGLKKRCERVP
jgi:hypothetical protein